MCWRVNTRIPDVARQARDGGLDLPGLPQHGRLELPPKPVDIDTNAEARRLWRHETARIMEANEKSLRKAGIAIRTLLTAEKFAAEPAFYFPHYCDWRGRMYPMVPNTFNIQGSDLPRALLAFAHGAPITVANRGERWLAIHVANQFGQDKLPLEDRITWTLSNRDLLQRIADDPLGNRQEWLSVTGGKGIWMALAAAQEWIAFRQHGYSYVTHLPCFIDGSANGLQHYAALAGDPHLAAATNLTASENPSDIYQDVALSILGVLRQRIRASSSADVRRIARKWLRIFEAKPRSGRQLAKDVVLQRGYGATDWADGDAITDFLDEADIAFEIVGKRDRVKARDLMQRVVRDAIADRIGSAGTVMQWLKDVAHEVDNYPADPQKIGIEWTSPCGWPWVQAACDQTPVQSKALFNGTVLRSVTMVDNPRRLNSRKQENSIPPNFIHALDASAMVFALQAMEAAGVKGVGAIHDSVGALCTDMDTVSKAIRDGFVRLYTEHDPLRSLRDAAAAQMQPACVSHLPAPPEPGPFDVRQVRKSEYFFS